MSDSGYRPMSSRRLGSLRALAAAAVASLLFAWTPAASADAAQLRWFTDPMCSPPTGQIARVEGFPPNEDISALYVVYGSGAGGSNQVVNYSFRTDGSGDAVAGTAGPGPLRVGGLFFRDLDRSGGYSRGDDVIADLLLVIDATCHAEVAQPK